METGGSDDVVVSVPSEADVDGVVGLAYELLLLHGRLAPDWTRPVGSYAEFRETWEAYLRRFLESDGALALVANEGRTAVGYVLAMLQERPPVMVGPPDLLICEIGVAEGQRGRGIGRRMLREAEEWGRLRGAEFVRLHVYEANRGAIRFYEREGFTTHERVLLRTVRELQPPS